MKHLILLLVFFSLIVGCGTKKTIISSKPVSKPQKSTPRPVAKAIPPKDIIVQKVPKADDLVYDLKKRFPRLNKSTLAYIEEYNDIAIAEMLRYEIPASITLAQGILESNSGRSRLTVKGNNHFGVKCHRSWKGKRIYHDDDARQECFRKYEHPWSSFRDHSLFLYERKRYAALFDLKLTNYKGWSRGLKKAGYATDPKYPKKLIALIEQYELYKYDDFNDKYAGGVTKVKKKAPERPGTFIVVKKGDTLYSIARHYNLTVDRLKWLNGLKSNDLAIGQKIYIEL